MSALYAKSPARIMILIGLAILWVASPTLEARGAVFGVPNGATNPNGWFVLTGTASANADGDTVHQQFLKIEVTGATLDVQIYDPGNSGARDLPRTGNTTTTYTLRDPLGTVLNTTTFNNDTGATDDALFSLTGGSIAVSPGLYELEVSMGGGTDVNAFGINVPGYEVYTSTDVPGGAEDGEAIVGTHNGGTPNANITQPMILYPYVDRGCEITPANYDMDFPVGAGAGASGSTNSRLGTSTALTMSGGTAPASDNINPIQQATQAQDYGIWRLDNDTGTQQNIIDWRVADYTGVTSVGAFLPLMANNPLRVYLPGDGSLPGTPVEPGVPRIEQSITPFSASGQSTPGGPNPPVAGSTSLYQVNVLVTNPTPNDMTGLSVTANVPGGEVLYDCSTAPITDCAQVTGGGTITTEPADGGSGNVTATWATLAGVVQGTTVTAPVDQDTYVKEDKPTQTNGSNIEIKNKNTTNKSERSLIHFDLSSIPANSNITSAIVSLYVTMADASAPINVHRVTDTWTEAGATWNNTGADFDAAVETSFSATPVGTVVTFDLAPLVQSWLCGTVTNNGIMLLSTSNDVKGRFSSKEEVTVSQRPTMAVTTSGLGGCTAVGPPQVSLTYFVAVTPAGAGVVNVTATPASGNGTRSTYTPAFSSLSFPRTENVGPLCQLMVQASTAVPNAVALSRLEARAYDGEVWLEWETASEWANLGFNVYRSEGSTGRFVQMNADLILGAGTSTLQASYLFIDPTARDGRHYSYLIEDVERTGKRTLHGPVSVTAGALAAASFDGALYDRVVTPGGEIPALMVAALGAPASGGAGVSTAAVPPLPGPAPETEVTVAAGKIWKVLSEDETGMLIELRSERPVLTPVVLDGVPYTDVSIPGFSHAAQPGKPALPALGVPIEIPAVADVTVTAEVHRTRSIDVGILPAPAPALSLAPDGSVASSYAPDAAVYGGSAAYPASPVALGGSVRQGDKKLLVLVLEPVAWSPENGALTHARRVRVRIDYHGAQAADAASSASARLENQFFLASRGALKILVEETGIQAVSGQALLDAGIDPATDPRTLALYREGREVAILFQGEENGVLDAGDRMLFYGENRDDDHTLARTYWLNGGNLSGLRMAGLAAAPTGTASGEMLTPVSVTLEKNLVYLPFVLNGETSNFVGDAIFLTPRDQSLDLVGVSGGPGTLHVRLQGATTDSNVNPDHHMLLSVNGVDVGHARWDGFDAFEGSFEVPAGVLSDGTNEVLITPVDDTGAVFDFDYIDRVRLGHDRTLDNAGASLAIRTTTGGDRTLGGIVGESPVLLDVTDPYAPVLLEGDVFTPGEGGGSLAFSVAGGERRLVMATEIGFVVPETIERDQPSNLSAAPGIDWLAIAHGDFVSGTAPLANLRAAEGLRVGTVDVQDVYDEFGFGDPDPKAIRDYLAWQYRKGGEPRLRYVLLVGDANHDERDYLGQPNRNFVSTKLLDGSFTERASDNWFASFLGDDALPDVALGRLPVRSPAELDDVVAKITGYASQPLGEEWQQRALLVSDDGFRASHAGEAAIFEATSNAMADQLPPGFDPLKIYLSGIPEADQQVVARQSILDALNAGALTASYAGHGAITLWADEVIFRTSDLASLDNAGRLPFVVVLNCLNGLFSAPLGDSLSESMLLMPNGGAVAFFAPTGVSPIGGQEIFGEAVSRALFREGHRRIGDALLRAREATLGLAFFEDLSGSWVLLGDPATTLAFEPIPIADAGDDLETKAKSRVKLLGNAHGGVAGTHAYAWRIVSAPPGSKHSLHNANQRRCVLRVDAPGDYVVELVVTAGGKTSAPDTVRVRALPRHAGKRGADDTL